jgi:hypothetical protein
MAIFPLLYTKAYKAVQIVCLWPSGGVGVKDRKQNIKHDSGPILGTFPNPGVAGSSPARRTIFAADGMARNMSSSLR